MARPDSKFISSFGSHERWANVEDRTAATQPACDAFNERFEREARQSWVAEVCRLLGDAAGTGWGPTLRLALLLIVIAGCYLIVRGIAS